MKLLILVACVLNVVLTVPVRERHPTRVTKKPETEHHGVRRRVERSASGSSEVRMSRFLLPRPQQPDVPVGMNVPPLPPIPIPVPIPVPLDPTAINAAGMPIAQYLVPAPAQFYPGFPGMAMGPAFQHAQDLQIIENKGFPPILGK